MSMDNFAIFMVYSYLKLFIPVFSTFFLYIFYFSSYLKNSAVLRAALFFLYEA